MSSTGGRVSATAENANPASNHRLWTPAIRAGLIHSMLGPCCQSASPATVHALVAVPATRPAATAATPLPPSSKISSARTPNADAVTTAATVAPIAGDGSGTRTPTGPPPSRMVMGAAGASRPKTAYAGAATRAAPGGHWATGPWSESTIQALV